MPPSAHKKGLRITDQRGYAKWRTNNSAEHLAQTEPSTLPDELVQSYLT